MATNFSAKPNLVQIRGLVDLYTSALEHRGYRPIVLRPIGVPSSTFLHCPRPTRMRWRLEKPPSVASSTSISVVAIVRAAFNGVR